MRIRQNRRRVHLAVQLHGRPRILALGKPSNHGVPREDIGGSNQTENSGRVGHGGREGDEGEDEVLAHVWIVGWDAMSDGEAVDLLELEVGGGAELYERDAFSEKESEVIFRES